MPQGALECQERSTMRGTSLGDLFSYSSLVTHHHSGAPKLTGTVLEHIPESMAPHLWFCEVCEVVSVTSTIHFFFSTTLGWVGEIWQLCTSLSDNSNAVCHLHLCHGLGG